MIHEEKCFVLTCDNCKETYCDENGTGFSMFPDGGQVWEYADNDGWYEQDGKHYCPKCYTINDNDELVVIPTPASIINK